MKRAVVTGSNGYIGLVLCKMLKEKGYYVIGVDTKLYVNNKYCDEMINDDIAAIHLNIKRSDDYSYFHLAASSLLGPSATNPLLYYENNTAKTIKLLQTMKPRNIVFASTAAVYAPHDKTVNERSVLSPPNNYGRSKLWCEQVIDSCFVTDNIRACSFRFFNVIGTYGEVGLQNNTPHVLSQLCEAGLKNKPFNINGTDYQTRDGTCVRDYVHVVDVCRAMIHMSELLDASAPRHFKYNLGTGIGTSVKEMVDIFRTVAKDVNTNWIGRREGDPPYLVADPSKFIEDTNFNYYYNSEHLPDIISEVWRSRQ